LSILRILTRNIEKIAGKDAWAGGLEPWRLPRHGLLRAKTN
jgi:hypothetical protein